LTLALIIYLSLRHWTRGQSPIARHAKKSLAEASRLLALKQWEEAKAYVLPYLHHTKHTQKAHLYYAQATRGLRRFDEALNCVRYAIRLFPEELLLRLEEGKILLDLEQPQEALEAFRVCSPILRQDSDILSLADALLKAGYAEACWDLISERSATTQHAQLKVLAAEALAKIGRLHDAIEFYNQAVELGERSHRVLNQLGHVYRRFGNLHAAETLFRSLLEKDPADVDATIGLGVCMEERGQYQKAFLIYQSGHAWEKKDHRLIKQAALAALHIHKYAYAEAYLAELIHTHLASATLWSYYGYSLEKQQKWQEAETIYLSTVEKFPSHVHGYRALAWMFGVGVSVSVTSEQGLCYAHTALKLLPDNISWEILSASEARAGNFIRATQILHTLLDSEQNILKRSQLQEALRRLRKEHPLDDSLVARALVA